MSPAQPTFPVNDFLSVSCVAMRLLSLIFYLGSLALYSLFKSESISFIFRFRNRNPFERIGRSKRF